MYGSPAAEYGTPSATFIIDGKVSSETNEALPGIKVVMEYDTTITDSEGHFQTKTIAWPDDQDFTLEISDTDGELNGSYQDLDTIINFTDPSFENGTGWHEGEVTKEIEVFRKYRSNAKKIHELDYLFWECTLRCNINCLHCGSDCSKEADVPDMPLEDFLGVLDDIKN